jgi:hypothetical protein
MRFSYEMLVANYEGTVVTLDICVDKQTYEKVCPVHLFLELEMLNNANN